MAFLVSCVPRMCTVALLLTIMTEVKTEGARNPRHATEHKISLLLHLWVKNFWLRDFSTNGDAREVLVTLDPSLVDLVRKNVETPVPAVRSQVPPMDLASVLQSWPKSFAVRMSPYSPSFVLHEHVDPKEVAHQVTLMEHAAFSCIGLDELQSQRWNKQPHLAANVRFLMGEFNRLSIFLAYMIVREFDLRQRVAVMQFCIDVGYEAFKSGNFNMCNIVVGALASSAVRRLKKTFSQLSSKHTTRLEKIRQCMSTSHNYSSYRAALRARSPPVMPYLGILLQDLVFTDESLKDWTAPGILNMGKFFSLYRLLTPVMELQNTPFPYRPIPELQMYLSRCSSPADEDQLYQSSKKCENKEAA